MTKVRIVGAVLAVLVPLTASQVAFAGLGGQTKSASQPKPASPTKKLPAAEIDGLMAPVALYPDQLLAQMLVSATTPARVSDLDKWLKTNPPFKGTALQDAAKQSKFEPSLVALVPFPQVVDFMATNLDWTTEVGQAFSADRAGVLDSVQRLRADSLKTGKLKSTPQQDVSLKTTESGQQVIVIEPANPQVVYVPQYDTKTVYSQPPTTSTVVVQEEDDDAAEAMAAGLIGFTAGIAIGAAMDNDYYYGPYGWHGSPYMHNDGWDDWYDDREDAREDWYDNRDDAREDYADHREDLADSRSDRASNAQGQRTERQSTAEQQRTERQQSGQSSAASTAQTARSSGGTSTSARATGQAAATPSTQSASSGTSSYQARGQDRDRSSTAAARSGTQSDAFSNYSSGKSERSASARGQSSRSGGGGGGGRGGGGGGGRRR